MRKDCSFASESAPPAAPASAGKPRGDRQAAFTPLQRSREKRGAIPDVVSAEDRIAPVAAVQRVVSADAVHGVDELVVAVLALRPVAAQPQREGVVADAPVEAVVTVVALDEVVAGVAVHQVVAGVAVD